MDHRIAKDMISSGMIPSGEKKQDDLNKTQYGTVPSPDALSDVYKKMYEHHKKDADGNTIPHEGEEINEALPLLLGKVAAIAGKVAAGAGKAAVKTGVKLGGKTGGKIAKSIVRDPVDSYYKSRMIGDMLPKPKGLPGIEKNATGNVSAGSYQAASTDLFDIVKGQLLDEGYSEKEITEIMVNLTEEQLDEFMKALATRAAQYGANLGKKPSEKINVLKRKPFDPKRKPFEAKPKPGDRGFVAKGAMDVVNAAAATRRKRMEKEMKPKNGEVMADNADLFDIVKGQLLDEGVSEEEIKDIMLTLTPDEILNEISVGKMANYISAADKDVQKTAASIKKDGSVMSDDPRVKKMTNRAQGMAVAGTKIAKKMSPPRMEEYKGSGTPEQQAAMKAQVEVSKKVNRYGGKTPSGTTAVDAKKGIEDVRKSM